MKLRFGIDPAGRDAIRARLDQTCEEPPVGRRLSYVYLDTPDSALASRGVALRFRRSTAIGVASPRRPWRRQEIGGSGTPFKKLGIPRLKQRVDATFTVRIERWSWTLDTAWAVVSVDETVIATGRAEDRFAELRIVCPKRHAEKASRYAVELGATNLSSLRARERGLALLCEDTSLLPG